MREREPVIIHTQKTAVNNDLHDGGIEPAVGVHNYQVLRANRTHPQNKNHRCYTYNHQPMLAYWSGRFYLQYLAGLHNEHEDRTETFLTSSADGIHWNTPEVIFPAIEYSLFRYTIAHQRVGFYVAPNGRLLTLSFYGIPRRGDPSRLPNRGNGIGRVVREIDKDNSLGPIYFFRYMPKAGYTEDNTSHWYPHYKKSTDNGFVEACEALCADKLFHQQMWEEDRNNDDGFFGIHWEESEYATGKALSYWTNPDGSVTGIWKSACSSVTRNNGQSWSEPVALTSIHKNNAKYWGQRTPDGRYALLYCASEGSVRTPLVVVTGDDGQHFDDMLVVHGDVPLQRFWGFSRDPGPQYTRGIVEGNGTPPGMYCWVTYSVNKEDIWVSRIPVPIKRGITGVVDDDFSSGDAKLLNSWNLYSGNWNRVSFAKVHGRGCLQLCDKDPYDYARARRVFPETTSATIEFRLMTEHGQSARLDVDILDSKVRRPVRLIFDFQTSKLEAVGRQEEGDAVVNNVPIGKWLDIEIHIDTVKCDYSLKIDKKLVLSSAKIAERVSSVKWLEFRTGRYRMADRRIFKPYRKVPKDSPDLDGADDSLPQAVFSIGRLKILT